MACLCPALRFWDWAMQVLRSLVSTEDGTLLLNLNAPMLSLPEVQLRAFIGKDKARAEIGPEDFLGTCR
jgi:hypothetical protein